MCRMTCFCACVCPTPYVNNLVLCRTVSVVTVYSVTHVLFLLSIQLHMYVYVNTLDNSSYCRDNRSCCQTTRQWIDTRCDTLQHTATHCNASELTIKDRQQVLLSVIYFCCLFTYTYTYMSTHNRSCCRTCQHRRQQSLLSFHWHMHEHINTQHNCFCCLFTCTCTYMSTHLTTLLVVETTLLALRVLNALTHVHIYISTHNRSCCRACQHTRQQFLLIFHWHMYVHVNTLDNCFCRLFTCTCTCMSTHLTTLLVVETTLQGLLQGGEDS